MTHKVVPRLQARRYGVCSYATGLHQLGSSPDIRRSRTAFFLDLEPHSTKSRLVWVLVKHVGPGS